MVEKLNVIILMEKLIILDKVIMMKIQFINLLIIY